MKISTHPNHGRGESRRSQVVVLTKVVDASALAKREGRALAVAGIGGEYHDRADRPRILRPLHRARLRADTEAARPADAGPGDPGAGSRARLGGGLPEDRD